MLSSRLRSLPQHLPRLNLLQVQPKTDRVNLYLDRSVAALKDRKNKLWSHIQPIEAHTFHHYLIQLAQLEKASATIPVWDV